MATPNLCALGWPQFSQSFGKYLADLFEISWVDKVRGVLPDLLFGLISSHPFHCRAHIEYGAVGVDNHDDVGGMLDQRAQALLAHVDSEQHDVRAIAWTEGPVYGFPSHLHPPSDNRDVPTQCYLPAMNFGGALEKALFRRF